MILALTITEKITLQDFPYIKALEIKFDLVIK